MLLQADSPPFAEHPCILEMDTFATLISLHYAHSTLLTALTAPPASQTVNPVIPSLEGISDQYLVRITTAAHILQYLLGTPPPPHADTRKLLPPLRVALVTTIAPPLSAAERAGSSPEFSVGMGLQEVWTNYRKEAG